MKETIYDSFCIYELHIEITTTIQMEIDFLKNIKANI